ncbi:hypothetical protein GCM10009733_071460 [Nonomuraea maheshkhaliensis]|uniref:Uncharacterized protein n=1 Tax=Nonomuraea maheshkhaliensis TaxID=419590 RepID=A0ABP4S059_9ACTN
MLRRHRSALSALILVGLYGAALTVAVVVALVFGQLGPLWWLALFTPVAEGAVVTPLSVLVLVLAGLSWVWAIWQVVRGPLAGSPPQQDRDVMRLRVALYVAAATTWLLHLAGSLAWDVATVIDFVAMWVVVLRFMPVLGGDRPFTRGAGVLGYGGFAVIGVFDLVGWSGLGAAESICALAALAWTALVLRAQWGDDRWERATFGYGLASVVAPIPLTAAAMPFSHETGVGEALGVVPSVLLMIWLARSAHDLAAPRRQPPAEQAEVVSGEQAT